MRGRTTIIVAHRLFTVTHANRIVVMNEGRIEDEGTHGDLMARCELYRVLYDSQFTDANEQVAGIVTG